MPGVTKNFNKFARLLNRSIDKSLKTFHKSIEKEILEVTPKDSGELRESFQFSKIENSGAIEYKFHFGQGLVGENGVPYASIVHEWYGQDVQWTTAGTGPGFLIRPVFAHKDEIADIIRLNAKRIKI